MLAGLAIYGISHVMNSSPSPVENVNRA
jgi:hypothetical protein